MRLDGSCACGAITFACEADASKVWICHCTDCQLSTGSAFRVNISVPGSAFRMLTGEPAIYVKTTADSGNPRAQAFCPTCGTPIYSTTPGNEPKQAYVVRVGTLKQRKLLAPRLQNWTHSAQPWVEQIAALPGNEKAAPAN